MGPQAEGVLAIYSLTPAGRAFLALDPRRAKRREIARAVVLVMRLRGTEIDPYFDTEPFRMLRPAEVARDVAWKYGYEGFPSEPCPRRFTFHAAAWRKGLREGYGERQARLSMRITKIGNGEREGMTSEERRRLLAERTRKPGTIVHDTPRVQKGGIIVEHPCRAMKP